MINHLQRTTGVKEIINNGNLNVDGHSLIARGSAITNRASGALIVMKGTLGGSTRADRTGRIHWQGDTLLDSAKSLQRLSDD